MLDYAETVVVTRARSLEIEEALQGEDWAKAKALALKQVHDYSLLYGWIFSRGRQPCRK